MNANPNINEPVRIVPDPGALGPLVRPTPDMDALLIANGYEPVPVRGKATHVPEWTTAEITPSRVAEWRAAFRDHIGTGLRTGKMLAIDIDILSAADAEKAEIVAIEVFGRTPLRRVGSKGCALLYRKEGEISGKQTIKLGDVGKIECFGSGGQVVAFGIHPDTGKPYRWSGETPLTVPLSELRSVTDSQIKEFGRRTTEAFGAQEPREEPTRPPPQRGRPITVQMLRDMLGFINPTMKDDFETWVGIVKLIWFGECPLVEGEQAPDWPALADEWCSGDLWRKRTGDAGFVVSTYPSGGRSELKKLLGRPRTGGRQTGLGTIVKLARQGGYSGPVAAGQTAESGYFSIGSDLQIAQRLLSEFETHAGEIVHSEGGFYEYTGSHWTGIDETVLRRWLNKYDGWYYGEKGVVRMNENKMSSILQSAATEREQREFFFQATVGINVKNGLSKFGNDGTPELMPHDRDHRRRHVLPHEWNPEIKLGLEAPLLMKLLDGCFEGDDDKQGKIDLVGEMMGAAALGNVTRLKEPKAFVLHGRTAGNGKSQLLDCVRGLLPNGAVKAISPADFGDDPKIIHLAGALLNATDELGSAQAITTDRFKAIITGDPVFAREVYQRATHFKPQALHVFATNGLPSFKGGFDRGVQRRLIVLPFNRTIPEAERVPHLGELIVRTEGAALLAFAVEGASRLLRQGRFTEVASCSTALRDWIVGTDPVSAWMEECVEYLANATTPNRTAYANFRDWAVDQGFDKFHLPAVNIFSQRVYAEDCRIVKGPRNNAVGRTFLGLRLVDHRNRADGSYVDEVPF